jgi:hypothetical protein
MDNTENDESKQNHLIDDLNKEIEELKKQRNDSWRENSEHKELYHRTLSKLRKDMMNCKLLTRNIKNLRLEYEHENSREFSTKLLMLLEHFKDDIYDDMNKESNEGIVNIMKSIFRFS